MTSKNTTGCIYWTVKLILDVLNGRASLAVRSHCERERSNLDVASDEKLDCRALWARNDDNFKTQRISLAEY